MKNQDALNFYQSILKKSMQRGAEKLLSMNDNTKIDAEFIKRYCHSHTRLLDLGSGSGLTIQQLVNDVKSIVAVEKYKEFSSFIPRQDDIKVITTDIKDYEFEEIFDLITFFGVAHYFSRQEISNLYGKSYHCLEKDGLLIVKNQFGIDDDVIINFFSKELKKKYYACYRHLPKEVALLKDIGFKKVTFHNIYPPEKNRWKNTHFYAIVATK